MLDIETKRRIDTCRDILVGKVPDPKSQVEQITIALIYKFMDDMDLQSEEMGGERSFFTRDFERYRWAKLVAPGVSGEDMLNTYSEALTLMVQNEDLPELFRDIFRNAYLPYRDSETLRAFLRQINSFTYDHSERLGDAFEYLLSVLGSQGDAGQFRTPRHIIDFMVEIVDPQKDEVILDPACGTAGFLISAYKYILKQNSTHVVDVNGNDAYTNAAEQALESPMRYRGNLLQPEDRARLADNIRGYDISPDMVRLSLVNLYLHRFPTQKIEEYDTLTSEDKWSEMADVILANPPFMSPKGGIKPHARFQVDSKRSEVLFVEYIAEHLTPKGRAAVIVPEGIIFQSQNAYVALRKMLVENYLAAVISLPAGVFNPYSGVKTSILILDRAVAKASNQVAFFKIENDGFALGAQRKAVKGSQLGRVETEIGAWLYTARSGGSEVLKSRIGRAVKRSILAEGEDYNLSAERYGKKKARPSRFEYRPLREFCNLGAGNPAPQGDQYFEEGTLPFVRTSDVGQAHRSISFASSVDKLTPEAVAELRLRLFPKGTILFPKSGASTFLNHRVMLAQPAYVSSHLACITPRHDLAVPEYVYYMLCGVDARDLVPDQAYPSLRLGVLGDLEIPLPPLDVQRKIVDEVEGYQRVVDGARAVLDNYRPHILVDPDWPMRSVAEVAQVNPKKSEIKGTDPTTSVSFVPMAVLNENNVCFNSIEVRTLGEVAGSYTYFRDDDVLVAKVTPCFENGKAGIARGLKNGIGFGSSEFYVVRAGSETLPAWLFHWLTTADFRMRAAAKMTGTGGLQRVPRAVVEEELIPVPDKGVQQAIVAELRAEQAFVNGNGDLISRFEKKIGTAVASVWSEAKVEGES